MKLYVYDHCPFCVRARMPLGLKGIEAETVFVPNHDEATPISMIGAKMLPILEVELEELFKISKNINDEINRPLIQLAIILAGVDYFTTYQKMFLHMYAQTPT